MERKQDTELSKLLNKYFLLLDNMNITYCVLRGYEKLPHWTRYDIDLAILPEHFDNAELILNSVAKELGWIKLSGLKQMGFRRILLWHPNYKDGILPIDFCLEHHYRGIVYIDHRYILSTRIRHKFFWIASPGCEAATRLIKGVLRFAKFQENDDIKLQISKLSCVDPHNFVNILMPYWGKNLAQEALSLCQTGQWTEFKKYQRKFLLQLFLNTNLLISLSRITTCFFNAISIKLKRRGGMSVKGGLFIVLLGPDGSGKTTIAQSIDQKIGHLFDGTDFFHSHFNIFPRLRWIKKIIYCLMKKAMPAEIDFTEKHSGALVKPHSCVRSTLYILYYGLEFILGNFLISSKMAGNRLVIFDRYFYDYFFLKAYMNAPRVLLNFFVKFLPQPDIIIAPFCPSDIIYKRKNELTPDEILRQQKIIDNIGLEKIYKLDTSIYIEQTMDSAVRIIMSKL